MIISKNIFSIEYIYSPLTKYHRMHPKTKLCFVIIVKILILYANFRVFDMFVLVICIVSAMNIKNKSLTELKLIQNSFVYLVYSSFIGNLITCKNTEISKSMFSRFVFPCYCRFFLTNKIGRKIILQYCYFSCFIPNYFIKLIYIYITIEGLYIFLFKCTNYNSVIETLMWIMYFIQLNMGDNFHKNMANLFLGCLFLENMNTNLYKLQLALKAKDNSPKICKKINCIFLVIKYIKIFINNQNCNSVILWNRGISYNSFSRFMLNI